MPFTSENRIVDKLQFVLQQIDFIRQTTKRVSCADDFNTSMDGVVLLNSTCMCLQTIGESLRAVDRLLGEGGLAQRYPQTPWHSIFALRNIISHEYAAVDSGEIFNIIKNDLDDLEIVVKRIVSDHSFSSCS